MNRLEERWQIRADCLWRRDITPTGNRNRWVWSPREREGGDGERDGQRRREREREGEKKREREQTALWKMHARHIWRSLRRTGWGEKKKRYWSQQGPKPRCQLGSCEVELTRREQPRPTFKSCLCSSESIEGSSRRWGWLGLRLKRRGGGLWWDKCWCDMIGPALSPCHALMISSPPQDLSRGAAKDGHH